MERVAENKLVRDPYPNRTLFSKEERRPEKCGVAQCAFCSLTSIYGTGLLSAVIADSRLNATCDLSSTTAVYIHN